MKRVLRVVLVVSALAGCDEWQRVSKEMLACKEMCAPLGVKEYEPMTYGCAGHPVRCVCRAPVDAGAEAGRP